LDKNGVWCINVQGEIIFRHRGQASKKVQISTKLKKGKIRRITKLTKSEAEWRIIGLKY